ncbi:MAG: ankyrin repeat domain-containing protein, partial [Thermoguttaceae bacterium]|nr:ankyrin repeat domain-containing protein [Thermoguttaceae bacterium]
MIHKSVLNICIFVLAVISSVCFGSENSDNQAQTGVKGFGIEDIVRFEQMFQTGEFDFHYRNESNKCSVIHYAAGLGNLNRVKLLVEKGADVNEKNDYGSTVLHYAAVSGKLKLVQYLVKKGADVNAKDNENMTAFDLAAARNKMDIVQWFIENGADINSEGLSVNTILLLAVGRGNVELVKLL